jgi:hypothetical protein
METGERLSNSGVPGTARYAARFFFGASPEDEMLRSNISMQRADEGEKGSNPCSLSDTTILVAFLLDPGLVTGNKEGAQQEAKVNIQQITGRWAEVSKYQHA